MGEKTEKATPKKLRDARKKGQVAKSQDLPSAFTFIISVWATAALSVSLYHYLGDFLIATFNKVPEGGLIDALPGILGESFRIMLMASLPILALVSFFGVIITFLTVGPVFAPEALKFDIKKFNPVDNLKAKFKLKTLVELVKSILKISVATYIIYDVMYHSVPVLIHTVSLPITGALIVFHTFLMEVVIKVGLFFIVVAVLDFAYQKMDFAKEMKMEKFEVKQEYKNTEGDPHIKSKRKQIAQEIAYGEGTANAVKKAQAVVTNPNHLAIAIGYRREIDPAPFILTMGQAALADRIIKLAQEYNVPVVRNIPLAHKLWDNGDVYDYVPENTYEALAEILRWISSLNTDMEYDYTPGSSDYLEKG